MKTKFFSIIMVLLAFSLIAKAQLAGCTPYITFIVSDSNREYSSRWYFPATGAEEQVYDEREIRSLMFNSIQVAPFESNSLKSLALHYRMYDPATGVPSNDDGWHALDIYVGEKNASLIFRDDIEELNVHKTFFLIDPEWVLTSKSLTLELYFDGEDSSDNHFFHNNGGENYKITFKIDEDIQKIQYLQGQCLLTENGPANFVSADFDENGVCSQTGQLGRVNSLAIEYFTVNLRYVDGVKPVDVSLQYRVYEEGHEDGIGWNRLEPKEYTFYEQYNEVYYYSYNVGLDLTEGLVSGKDYVFEFYYQVARDGICYVFGSKEKGCGTKFTFTYEEEVVLQPFKSVSLSFGVNDDEPEEMMLPISGYSETVIDEPVHSFQLYGVQVMTDETIQGLSLYTMIYEKNNPESEDVPIGKLDFMDLGFGLWATDIFEPWEIVRESWKKEGAEIIVELYLEAYDAEGHVFHYNNDGQNYKYTFTCGEGGSSSANGLKNLTLATKFNGEEIPIELPASDMDDIRVPFKLYSLMVMGAELTTDQPMQSVSFKSKTYSPGQQNSVQWETIDFVQKDDNTWKLEFPYGKDIILDEWLGQRLKKTFEFFVSAENEEGNTVYYNNDDLNYRISFQIDETVGVNEVAGQRTTDNGQTIFNLVGQRMSKMQKGVNIVDGKKILVK